jgi:hypothetical protein
MDKGKCAKWILGVFAGDLLGMGWIWGAKRRESGSYKVGETENRYQL